MKNSFSLSLLIVSLTFFACGKANYKEDIIGRYVLDNYEIKSDCNDPDILPENLKATSDGCIELWGEEVCRSAEFKAGDIVILTERSLAYNETYVDTVSYTIDEDGSGEICFDLDCDDPDEIFEFTFNGSQITLTGNEDLCTTIEIYNKS